jgi:hypothetical protein
MTVLLIPEWHRTERHHVYGQYAVGMILTNGQFLHSTCGDSDRPRPLIYSAVEVFLWAHPYAKYQRHDDRQWQPYECDFGGSVTNPRGQHPFPAEASHHPAGSSAFLATNPIAGNYSILTITIQNTSTILSQGLGSQPARTPGRLQVAGARLRQNNCGGTHPSGTRPSVIGALSRAPLPMQVSVTALPWQLR